MTRRTRQPRAGPSASARDVVLTPFLRELLLVLIALKLIGTILLFDPVGLSVFDLPKAAFGRATSLLLVGTLALAGMHGRLRMPRSLVSLAVAALVAANVMSTIFALHLPTALHGDRARYMGLSFVLDMAVLYVAIAVACRVARDWVWPLGAIAFATAITIAYGAAQYLGLDPVGFPGARLRPIGTLGNADPFAHLLGVVSSGAFAVALFSARARVRAAAGVLGAIAVAVIGLVATRGALLGLAAGAVAIAVLYVARDGRRALRPLAALVAIATVAIPVVVAVTPLGARMATIFGGPELADRLVIWDGTWHAFLAHPLFGAGPDSLAVVFPSVRRPGTEVAHAGAVFVNQAHNWVLQALATTGVAGLLGLLAIIGASVAALWGPARHGSTTASALLASSAAYWAHGLVTVEAASVSWIPWLVAGAAASVAGASAPAASRQRAAARRVPRLLDAAVAIAAIGAALGTLPFVRANEAAWRAANAVGPRDPATIIRAAGEAVALDPGRAEYWNYRGLGWEFSRQYAAAADDYAAAAERTPHQVTYVRNLARARASQALTGDASGGGAAAAFAAARRAIATDPNLSSSHRSLAEVAFAFDDHELALTESLVAVGLNPRDATSDEVIVSAALGHRDRTRALELLDQILALRTTPVLVSARQAVAGRD